MTPSDKQTLKTFLDNHRLMTLATKGDHLWAASVYYVADDDLNLYFVSPPTSLHAQQLKQHPEVACAIADSSQEAHHQKRGLQLYGEATEETGLTTVKWMLNLFNKLHPSTADKLNFKNFQSRVMTSRVYKITPKRMKLFDEAYDPKNPERPFDHID